MSRAEKMRCDGVSGASGSRATSSGRRARCASWAAALLALLPGCGAAGGGYGETDEDDAEIEALEQPITGGTLTNGAFPAVVRLLATRDCTATKISDFKFLTAAHCVDPLPGTVDIIDVSGVQTRLSIPIRGIQVHPSWALIESVVTGTGAAAADSYDVAVITTTTPTPTLPTILPIPTSAVTREPITVTGVGFGCDNLVAGRAGRQQRGLFDLTLLNGTHRMTDLGNPSQCEGDSGGPALNSNNRIIGVMGQGATNQSSFQRMSNVRGWVLNPVPGNDASLFQGGQVYFMHNRPATAGLLGLCMASSASSGSNVSVQLSDCADQAGLLTAGRAPGWSLIPSSTAGRFVIVNIGTGTCLAAPNGAANANLRLETCANGFTKDLQKWRFTTNPNPAGLPVLRIRNHSNGLCIRSENNSTALGTLIEQTPCDAATSLEANTGQSWVAMRQ